MTPRRSRIAFRWRTAIAAALSACLSWLWSPTAAQADRSEPYGAESAAPLPSLQRIVKTYDFEQESAGANSLPIPFFRYAPAKDGFPPFGATRLTNEAACTGKGSLEFDLEGGSMAVRIPASVINVLPLADYVVSVKVRTEGLKGARARLVAWLHDTHGRIIDRTRVASRLAQTGGAWESLSVEIRGTDADAADLAFELQVLQPAQFDAGAPANAPHIQDTSGRAWFDDVVVSHLPRVSLTMRQTANIVRLPQQPELLVRVNELTAEALTARVRVFDIDGNAVFDTSLPAPRGRQTGTARVPLAKCGWYRAVLDISNRAEITRRQTLDFVVLPERSRTIASDRTQFGVVLQDEARSLDEVPAALAALGAGTAVVPMWTEGAEEPDDHAARRALIERLLQKNVELVVSLNAVPARLAREAGVDRDDVLRVLQMDPKVWRPYLDDLLVNFGLEVGRWQIGRTGIDALGTPDIAAAVERAGKSFGEFMPQPQIVTPCSIERTPDKAAPLPAALSVPHEAPPESIGAYAADWTSSRAAAYAALELQPAGSASPRQRLTDLMLRTLWAWRAGLPAIAIKAPWRDGDGRAGIVPEPEFAVWRTLAEQLSARTFIGELPVGPGQHCWILKGAGSDDSVMIAWSDRLLQGQTDELAAQLGNGPIEVTDAFGNAAVVEPDGRLHHVPLGDLPVFIQKMNLELVQFRSGIRIEPGFVPAIAKAHEHQIVLRNPWDVAVSGTIRVVQDDQWQITPDLQEFAIPARGETRLPLFIVPQRSILAGSKEVSLQIDLHADQHYSLALQSDLEVGLADISLAASWSVAANPRTGVEDLIVTQVVTNRGARAMNLEVYLVAEDTGQNRKTIPMLGPGQTQVRTFRIPNGVAVLGGKSMRVGVSERDGLTRLNYLLNIPAKGSQPLHADAATGSN